MTEIDFLNPAIKHIKQSILDIDSSYNHDWDLLAELCQNSVDAIKLSSVDKGRIEISINSVKRSIEIKDNGCGINPDDAEDLLKPFSTNKTNQEDSVGEKGVGLTFAMFSSNLFEIESGNENGKFFAQIKNASSWKQSTDNISKLLMEIDIDYSSKTEGTKVKLENITIDAIFKLTFEQLKFVLRTKTAIGNTLGFWGTNSKNIEVNLEFIDQDGNKYLEKLPYQYLLPYELIDQNSNVEDLDSFVEWTKVADRADIDKRKRLANKIIIKKGSYVHSDQRIIRFLACFVPTRSAWDKLSIMAGLCSEEQLEDPNWLDNLGYARFESGIYTSVKGMPTGISIEHPTTGYSGYWSNFFILFEDKNLRFDIGRKAIHGMQSRIYKDYAKKIFNEYLTYVTKYVSGEVKEPTEYNKDQIFAEIDKIIDLDSKKVIFKKSPKEQEASVAAIFFECIGNKTITDLIPLHAGYRGRYDVYALYGAKRITIEFKAKLKNILKDFNDEVKMFDEINCIVCWDVSEDDIQALSNKGVTCQKIQPSALFSNQTVKQIPSATHILSLSGLTNPVYVIDMKLVIM